MIPLVGDFFRFSVCICQTMRIEECRGFRVCGYCSLGTAGIVGTVKNTGTGSVSAAETARTAETERIVAA